FAARHETQLMLFSSSLISYILCSVRPSPPHALLLLFFNATATTEIYTLSLHDALPISEVLTAQQTYLSAQISNVNDRLQQLTAGVNLYRALGGGWNKVIGNGDNADEQQNSND